MAIRGRMAGAACCALVLMGPATFGADMPAGKPPLPPAMHGVWAYEPADCDVPDSDGLLTIGARSVEFFASAYDLRRATRLSNGTVRASGLRSDEGEEGRTQSGLTLRLLTPDRLLVIANSPGGHVYHRCGQGRR